MIGMNERVNFMRFEDGPLASVPEVPAAMFEWPLPDRLGVLTHEATPNVAFWNADDPAEAKLPDLIVNSPNAVIYAKVSESQLPEDVPGVVRGALYRMETP
jgi:hypothetical protein